MVTDLVRALGGPTKVAGAFNVGPSAVSNWQRLGRFPSHTFIRLTEQLRRKGIEAPPGLWGMQRK